MSTNAVEVKQAGGMMLLHRRGASTVVGHASADVMTENRTHARMQTTFKESKHTSHTHWHMKAHTKISLPSHHNTVPAQRQ
jgi:hypothetical protein